MFNSDTSSSQSDPIPTLSPSDIKEIVTETKRGLDKKRQELLEKRRRERNHARCTEFQEQQEERPRHAVVTVGRDETEMESLSLKLGRSGKGEQQHSCQWGRMEIGKASTPSDCFRNEPSEPQVFQMHNDDSSVARGGPDNQLEGDPCAGQQKRENSPVQQVSGNVAAFGGELSTQEATVAAKITSLPSFYSQGSTAAFGKMLMEKRICFSYPTPMSIASWREKVAEIESAIRGLHQSPLAITTSTANLHQDQEVRREPNDTCATNDAVEQMPDTFVLGGLRNKGDGGNSLVLGRGAQALAVQRAIIDVEVASFRLRCREHLEASCWHPIPEPLLDCTFDSELQPQSSINANDIFLSILNFVELCPETLVSMSHACKAWRERVGRAPQWHTLTLALLHPYYVPSSVVVSHRFDEGISSAMIEVLEEKLANRFLEATMQQRQRNKEEREQRRLRQPQQRRVQPQLSISMVKEKKEALGGGGSPPSQSEYINQKGSSICWHCVMREAQQPQGAQGTPDSDLAAATSVSSEPAADGDESRIGRASESDDNSNHHPFTLRREKRDITHNEKEEVDDTQQPLQHRQQVIEDGGVRRDVLSPLFESIQAKHNSRNRNNVGKAAAIPSTFASGSEHPPTFGFVSSGTYFNDNNDQENTDNANKNENVNKSIRVMMCERCGGNRVGLEELTTARAGISPSSLPPLPSTGDGDDYNDFDNDDVSFEQEVREKIKAAVSDALRIHGQSESNALYLSSLLMTDTSSVRQRKIETTFASSDSSDCLTTSGDEEENSDTDSTTTPQRIRRRVANMRRQNNNNNNNAAAAAATRTAATVALPTNMHVNNVNTNILLRPLLGPLQEEAEVKMKSREIVEAILQNKRWVGGGGEGGGGAKSGQLSAEERERVGGVGVAGIDEAELRRYLSLWTERQRKRRLRKVRREYMLRRTQMVGWVDSSGQQKYSGILYFTQEDYGELSVIAKAVRKAQQKCMSKQTCLPLPDLDRIFLSLRGLFSTAIVIGVCFISAFFMGYNHNAIDTDVKLGATYFFSFLSIFSILMGLPLLCVGSTRTGMASITFCSYFVTFTISLIAGLVGMRLATLRYLDTKPIFFADRCRAYNDGVEIEEVNLTQEDIAAAANLLPSLESSSSSSSSVVFLGPAIIPRLVVFNAAAAKKSEGEGGASRWVWESHERMLVNVSLDGGATNWTYPVLFLMWNNSLLSENNITAGGGNSSCKGTGLPRRVAFLVPSVVEANSGSNNSRPFTVDDLPVDPIDAYLNNGEGDTNTSNDNFTTTAAHQPPLELRVPMPLKYDEPFAYTKEEMAMFERWYDHSPLWLNWRVPLLPGAGDGSLLGANPRALPSPEGLKSHYWKVFGVLGIICAGVTAWTTLGLLATRKFIRTYIRLISICVVSLVMNPITMATWGGVCALGNYPKVCYMSQQSGLALFISGIVLFIAYVVAFVILVLT